MGFSESVKKIYGKLVLVKKLLWFLVNFVGMMTPFRQIRALLTKSYRKLVEMASKLNKLTGNTQIYEGFKEIEGQTVFLLALAAVAVAFIYFKFFKSNPNKTKKDRPKSKLEKQFDQISQKSIVQQTKMIRQEKQEIDSCCEELRNQIQQKPSNQDRVFLAILERYQSMRDEHQEEEIAEDKEFSKNNNKLTLDNSTQEGNFKNSLRKIPITPSNKKDGDDLNRSSVL